MFLQLHIQVSISDTFMFLQLLFGLLFSNIIKAKIEK